MNTQALALAAEAARIGKLALDESRKRSQLRGPKGEPGQRGDRGQAGPRGERGEPGPKGDQGLKGDIGQKGERGPTGNQGPKGERGPRGPEGIAGPRGEVGPMGIMGLQGRRGEPGPIGPKGERGEKGDRGEPGPRGLGIAAASVNASGELILEIENGQKVNAGRVRGSDGLSLRMLGGSSGISEARVVELIEASMPTADVEYPRIVTTVTTAGANVLKEPAAGNALRVRRIKCTADPDSADTPMLTLRLGSKLIQRGPVLYGADYVEGAVNDPLILDLESAANIGVTILYEEFTPA